MSTSLGTYLRAARERQGLTLRQVADAAGIGKHNYLDEIERGVYTPDVYLIDRLAAALGLQDTDYLLTLAGRMPPDIVQLACKARPETVEAAWQRMREALRGGVGVQGGPQQPRPAVIAPDMPQRIEELEAENERLLEMIRELVMQFAYEGKSFADGEVPVRHTGGLSALEEAFGLLGWTDPMLIGEDTHDQ